MDFSLTYAFGAMGRHTRKIFREARRFVYQRFRSIEPGRLRDYLFAQYFSIDSALFTVFYNNDPQHDLYAIHKKYANRLLDVTESELRHLARAYAFSLHASQTLSITPDEEEVGRVEILQMIVFVYDRSSAPESWVSLVLQPDDANIGAALCREIADAMQFNPRDEAAFCSDWISLMPGIINVANMLYTTPDWSRSAASVIEEGSTH